MDCVNGGVSEWFKEHAWKVCMRETVSRVRISPPPLPCLILILILSLSPFSFADLATYNMIPLKLETGARYLGIGSAASSIAYDANSIFFNPGALPWSKGVTVTVKDSNNISAGEAYPTGYGTTLGIGTMITSIKPAGNVSASSNALILSIGTRLDSILNFPENESLTKNTGFGISFKTLLGQSLSVPGQPDQTFLAGPNPLETGLSADEPSLLFVPHGHGARLELPHLLAEPSHLGAQVS